MYFWLYQLTGSLGLELCLEGTRVWDSGLLTPVLCSLLILEAEATMGVWGAGGTVYSLASVQQGRETARESSSWTRRDLWWLVPFPIVVLGLGVEVKAGWRGAQQAPQLSWRVKPAPEVLRDPGAT